VVRNILNALYEREEQYTEEDAYISYLHATLGAALPACSFSQPSTLCIVPLYGCPAVVASESPAVMDRDGCSNMMTNGAPEPNTMRSPEFKSTGLSLSTFTPFTITSFSPKHMK
jgi:hypothetical protein